MRQPFWRIAPLLLFAFFLFLASSTAQDATPRDHDDRHTTSRDPAVGDLPPPPEDDATAETVREAMSILKRIKPPTVSQLARYTSRPKGFLGTGMYYAKEAFVLLFMSGPKQSNPITTSTSQSRPKLSPSLSKAVKLLEEAAEVGSADAMYLLADMNFYGNFTHPIDYTTAFDRYQELADFDGNSTAQHMLGFLYATGLSPEIPADQAKSMLYHSFAAEQGNTRSQMTLAYRHHAGVATPRNCDEAVHWYKMVADKAVAYYRSGPPGGHSLAKDSFRLADEQGGVYGDGASVSSAGVHAKQGGPTSDQYADVEDVLEYLHLQSSKGDTKATFGLARIYYDGARGMKRDFRAAKKHFMEVAREYWTESGKTKKDVPGGIEKLASKAAGYLGRMFLRGEGMEQSFSKAKIWFQRGVSNGDALSQYSLGLMYLHGLGVPQDAVHAADYLAAAADQDLAVAQTNLGILFLDQGDVATATRYFELAAKNNHIEAFYYLAELSDQAIGRDRSCGMAAVYYKIVAEKAEAIWSSVGEANTAYEDEGDIPKAIVHYLISAEQGSEIAQANVAWLLDQTQPRWSPLTYLLRLPSSAATVLRDAATLALTYWTRSAKQQNIDSLVKMGDYYLSGLGALVSSPENAAACYQAAAETMQSAQALWNLGWMHENGIGIDQDFHLAKRFYDQALETNQEAYLPVKLSLVKLRWRSWWNDVTRGGIKSIHSSDDDDDPSTRKKKRRSFAEWINDFLEADAQMYEREIMEADDWEEGGGGGQQQQQQMYGSGGAEDGYWEGGEEYGDDDGLLETLLIGGLLAALAWLVWYRQQQQQRQQQQNGQGQVVAAGVQAVGGAGGVPAAPQQQQQQQQPQPGQQPDGGFFPQPGDPAWNAWAAGGVGH